MKCLVIFFVNYAANFIEEPPIERSRPDIDDIIWTAEQLRFLKAKGVVENEVF